MVFFEPFLDVFHSLKGLKPAFISKKPHFNFITVHYFWIIGLSIVCSIFLYPRGNIKYIDALFFSSGACTQSGLNTIDLNQLNMYQQVVLFFFPMLTNPITINTFVVFLRLYWFEKRFQHIAKEAKARRGTLSKSRSQMVSEQTVEKEERGVGDRVITVLHHTTRGNALTDGAANADPDAIHNNYAGEVPDENVISSADSDASRKAGSSDSYVSRHDQDAHAQITFAREVKRSDGMDDEELRMPVRRDDEAHIAFLQRQRNPDEGVLRIPGPRDADAGIAPETLNEEDARIQHMLRRDSTLEIHTDDGHDLDDHTDGENENSIGEKIRGRGRNITIQEPEPRGLPEHAVENVQAAAQTLNIFRLRKPRLFRGKKLHEEEPHFSKPTRTRTFSSLREALSRDTDTGAPYLSWEPTVGRNSAFVDLSESQREELGGIEYRSLKSLALILVLYFWGFTLFGFVCLTPWITQTNTYGSIVDADGQSRVWWGFFTTTSAFNDVGFTLTPDSMISFRDAIWPLLVMSFLVIIGNTGFPIMLRWVIWVTSQYVPKGSGIWEELKFLLDHPRRCFTLLFPSTATWWLFWILVTLNGLDLIFFIILDLGNTIVTALPVNIRVLDGWFQAVSTRTAGFAVVNLSDLHPAIQVSYLVMMYISVLPIAISVRRTNVYEEKSLGIWGKQAEEDMDEAEPSYVGAHLRRQLSFDLWYIFLGFFIISISEGSRLQDSNDPAFTMFSVLFEIVSAYGTVGLSLGYPSINASFSAEFGVIAKLVIIAMQIRGRHRGLPYELDRAILLPSESLQDKENRDLAARRRRPSVATVGNANSHGGSSENRNKSRERKNFISSMLHPGPTIPNSHRYLAHGQGHNHPESEAHNGIHRAATANIASLSSHREHAKENGHGSAFQSPGMKKRMSV